MGYFWRYLRIRDDEGQREHGPVYSICRLPRALDGFLSRVGLAEALAAEAARNAARSAPAFACGGPDGLSAALRRLHAAWQRATAHGAQERERCGMLQGVLVHIARPD